MGSRCHRFITVINHNIFIPESEECLKAYLILEKNISRSLEQSAGLKFH